MSPRKLLLGHARQHLRWARQSIERQIELVSDAYRYRSHDVTEALVETQTILILHHIGQASALREFAQRLPRWPQWCGCGDWLGPLNRSKAPELCHSCEIGRDW